MSIAILDACLVFALRFKISTPASSFALFDGVPTQLEHLQASTIDFDCLGMVLLRGYLNAAFRGGNSFLHGSLYASLEGIAIEHSLKA